MISREKGAIKAEAMLSWLSGMKITVFLPCNQLVPGFE